MLELKFSATDLARTNLAYSPLMELVSSLQVFNSSEPEPMYQPWIDEVRPRVESLRDLELLQSLVANCAYLPDFLTPPPVTPNPQLDAELAVLARTDPVVMRRDLDRAHPDGLPPALASVVAEGQTAACRIIEALQAYWNAALAPVWPRLRDVLDADILVRARDLGNGGAAQLFGELHPAVHWRDGTLAVEREWSMRLELGGGGLLLVPAIFTWPRLLTISDPPLRPTLVYPARGVATLWVASERPSADTSLGRLMGGQRAALLRSLDAPATTTQLARRMGVSAGGVSQHLAVLRDAGLVRSSRAGRVVLYMRTSLGAELLTVD